MQYRMNCFKDSSYSKEFYRFVCLCHKVKNFPEIVLNINDYIISFRASDLFIRINDMFCSLTFQFYKNETFNPNEWILGSSFLNKHIISFNIDNNSITLYSTFPFPHIEYSSNLYLLFIFIFIMLTFGIFLNCFILNYYHLT